jgi:hypothetical protein
MVLLGESVWIPGFYVGILGFLISWKFPLLLLCAKVSERARTRTFSVSISSFLFPLLLVLLTPFHIKVSVGNSGKIWGVSLRNEVFKYSPHGWKKRGELSMKHVSVGADGSVWAIENQTNSIYRWLSKTNEWYKVSAPLRGSAGSMSFPLLLSFLLFLRFSTCFLFFFFFFFLLPVLHPHHQPPFLSFHSSLSDSGSSEEKEKEKMKSISVGGERVVWGVSTSNVLYHWIESDKKWQSVTDQDVPLKGVSVAADGTVVGFGLDLEKKLKLKGKLHL